MASLWTWQNSPAVIRIQDKNYVGEGISLFYERWKEFRALVPDNVYESNRGIGWYTLVDKAVRIPGRYYNAANLDYVLNLGAPGDELRVGVSNLGHYTYGESDSELLDFIPRLYVELTPLSDFINNTLSPLGITNYWAKKFVWAYYDNPPYGKSYIPLNASLLTSPLNKQYVLTKYEIYTNTPNATQSLLASYGTNEINGNLFDTFIPLMPNGNKGLNAWGGYYTLPMVPYMRQFRTIVQSNATWNGFFNSYRNTAIGEAGNLGNTDGLLFNGVNQIFATISGNFTENPFVNTLSYMDAPKHPKLTDFPQGNAAIMFCTDISTWKKIFNGSGMAWSDDIDKVKSPDDSELNKPTFPGMPDNPTGGGDGDGDNISDDIPLPTVKFFPNNNAYNRYWLKSSDLTDLQNWIFGETFLNDIQRLWNDPAEYLINISYYPFNGYLHDVNNVQQSNISIGNLTSNISAFAMGDGYSAKFRGGTFQLNEYYGTYLDYAPYTSAEIYIPYIGYKQLNVNDIMGKILELIYAVDWDTNVLTATIMADDKPLTMYSGSFGVKLSLSGSNANQVAETIAQGIIGTVTSAGMAVAAGVAGETAGAIAGGVKAANKALDTFFSVQNYPRQFGTPTPATGIYNTQIPHLIIHRPMTAEPESYKNLLGYSAGYSGKVSEFSGFLKCRSVQISGNDTISGAEQLEIINLMKGGIFI